MPAIPTVTEYGVPRDMVLRLNAALKRALQTPEVSYALLKQGLEPAAGSPEQFAELIRVEMVRSADLIRRAGLKAE